MNVVAREFHPEAGLTAQIQHYADVRRRLFNPVPKAKVIEIAPTVAKPIPAPVVIIRPLWTIVELRFDWHIRAWREAIDQRIGDLAHENIALRAALDVHKADMEMAFTPRRPSKQIVAEVLRDFPGITWEDVKGHRRTRDIVTPRQICMYEIHKQRKDMSYPAIGRLFGGRDHTTVLHAVRKIKAQRGEE